MTASSSWKGLILNKAVQFLARRSHSEAELKQKLWHTFSNKNHVNNTSPLPTLSPTELQEYIESVIERCRHHHWLNDKEFAESYYAMRQRNGYGHRRILLELKSRGIFSEITDYFSSKNEESQENIFTMANHVKRKYGTINRMDLKQKKRIYRFLLNRGFSWEFVNNVYSLVKN